MHRQNNRILFFLVLHRFAVCLLLFGVLFSCGRLKTQESKKIPIQVGAHPLSVEVAADSDSRERGLMFRTELKADEGMLFVFPYPRRTAFWMKNTLIPLDIGYFSPGKRLTEYKTMETDNGAKTYPSSGLVLYVVETNAGWFEKKQIQKNTLLKLPYKVSAR